MTRRRMSGFAVIVVAFAVVAGVVAGAFWFDASINDDGGKKGPTAAPSQSDGSSGSGYQNTDMFESPAFVGRLSLPYKERVWVNYPGIPEPGVHKIMVTNHCDLTPLTKCPTLTFTHFDSPAMKVRDKSESSIIAALNPGKCPVTGQQASTKLTRVGTRRFGNKSGSYYRQVLCTPTSASMVTIKRYVWVSTECELLVELTDGKLSQTTDQEVGDVETALSGITDTPPKSR